jgi:hypothetical protein
MAGYMARVGGATGTLDPLTISALSLSTGDRTLVIVSADILGVDRGIVDEIAQLSGIEPRWLAVCASHTHSGPAGIAKQVRSDPASSIDTELRRRFIETCADVATIAMISMVEAELTYGAARVKGVSANRNAESGPFDPSVHVLKARDRKRKPIATLVHFACHPTILPASSNLISADFPGAIRRSLRADRHGFVVFANGAAGDISTRFTRKSQDSIEVQRVGKEIAAAVERVDMFAQRVNSGLELVETEVELAPRNPQEIRSIIEDARSRLIGVNLDDIDSSERRIAETRLQGIEILERLAESLSDQPTVVAIPRWRVGELELMGIPGELFASLGELCTTGDDRLLILGYTNGYYGYFADQAAYDDGLYEALASPFAPGASEAMVGRLLGDQ